MVSTALRTRVARIQQLNGMTHGLFQEWRANGQKEVECFHVNGMKHGLCQEWDEDGVKIKEATYVNGVRQ